MGSVRKWKVGEGPRFRCNSQSTQHLHDDGSVMDRQRLSATRRESGGCVRWSYNEAFGIILMRFIYHEMLTTRITVIQDNSIVAKPNYCKRKQNTRTRVPKLSTVLHRAKESGLYMLQRVVYRTSGNEYKKTIYTESSVSIR